MVNYNDSKVYLVQDNDNPDLKYIGSTARDIKWRTREHKHHANRYNRGTYGYNTVFVIINRGNYTTSIVEEYPCENRSQLEDREAYWINEMKPNVNKCKKRP